MAKEKQKKLNKKHKAERLNFAKRIKARYKSFMSRRPNRSFRLTKRRDARKQLAISGYWAFTAEVTRLLWGQKRLFGAFLVLYGMASILTVGFISSETYNIFSEIISEELEVFETSWQGVLHILTLLGATAGGVFAEPMSDIQTIITFLCILLGWLTMVWLLRETMAGHAVKLRDGLYSSGAPIISSLIVVGVILIQILPVSIGVLAYSILSASNIVSSGVEAMAAWSAIALLATLSLYWITSSLVALVIVTLPGMYPFAALKKASDLVVGRRTPVLLRLLWSLLIIGLTWIIVLLLAIILHETINTAWLAIVPIVIVLLSSLTLIWFSTYVYLLYRRLLDD